MLKASHLSAKDRTKSKLILQNNTWFSWKSYYYSPLRNMEMKVRKTVTSRKSSGCAKIPYKFSNMTSRLTFKNFRLMS